MTLNIAYIFDANYLMQTGVSVFSLLTNNSKEAIHFFLIHPKKMPKDLDKLHETIESFGSSFSTFHYDEYDALLNRLKVPLDSGHRVVYYRLFLAELIPQIDRLLYLDGDTIILNDLSPLYQTDLGDKIIGMAYDSNSNEVKYAFGLKDDEPYYNAGIILYDLKKYREKLDMDKTVEAIRTICVGSILPDQDLLNLQFKKQIKTLDPRYNYQPIHRLFTSDVYLWYFKTGYYSKEQLDSADENTVILHSLRLFGDRPWDVDSHHPHKKDFDEYKSKSVWSEFTLKKKKKNTIHIIEYHLYKIMPKKLFLYVFYKIHKRDIMNELKVKRKNAVKP